MDKKYITDICDNCLKILVVKNAAEGIYFCKDCWKGYKEAYDEDSIDKEQEFLEVVHD